MRIILCTLLSVSIFLTSYSQYHGEVSVQFNGGFSIAALSKDALVFPERADDDIGIFHHNIMLMSKSSFGESKSRFLLGVGYSGHFLTMKRYKKTFAIVFDEPAYKDSSLVQTVSIHRQGLCIPFGFESGWADDDSRKAHLAIGVVALAEFPLNTTVNSYGNFPHLDSVKEATEIE